MPKEGTPVSVCICLRVARTRGVANGIIGCDLTQVNAKIQGVVRNIQDVGARSVCWPPATGVPARTASLQVNTIHVINSVHSGPALEAGVRPMDVLIEVAGQSVENKPVSVMKTVRRAHLVFRGVPVACSFGSCAESLGPILRPADAYRGMCKARRRVFPHHGQDSRRGRRRPGRLGSV